MGEKNVSKCFTDFCAAKLDVVAACALSALLGQRDRRRKQKKEGEPSQSAFKATSVTFFQPNSPPLPFFFVLTRHPAVSLPSMRATSRLLPVSGDAHP